MDLDSNRRIRLLTNRVDHGGIGNKRITKQHELKPIFHPSIQSPPCHQELLGRIVPGSIDFHAQPSGRPAV